MKRPAPTRSPRLGAPSLLESLLVVAATLAASITAICWSWTHHAFLLYGDAEAHIHIARRLFDSHRPGITQLGSVWLPLPHLLLVPFLLVDPWWRNGFAPVIPSAACYLLACFALYRLMRKWLSASGACVALALFAANPNLLYLQTTAMTEPLFLCELIWTVLLLVEWYESLDAEGSRAARLLWAIIVVLVAAVFTRYDGWILALLAWAGMAFCLAQRQRLLRPNFVLASLVLLSAPAGWMAYNAVVFGDWLDFARGPYSALAIELRTASSASDPHPGWHNPWVSLLYFAKDAEMDVAARGWGEFVFAFAGLGTILIWLKSLPSSTASDNRFVSRIWSVRPGRAWLWTLLLWLPLPFYAYSVSYGSVPIFIPVWKPFSWYNTRYGMELLAAFSFFIGFVVDWEFTPAGKRKGGMGPFALPFFIVLLAGNLIVMLQEGPLTYVEAKKNAESRGYYNTLLSSALKQLHQQDPNGVVLMNTSTFPTVVPLAGLTYAHTVNESDKEFYWAALAAPASHADIVLAFAGDDIDKAVHAHPEHLRVYQTFHAPGKAWDQLDATLYVTDTFPLPQPAVPSTAVPRR